MSLLYQQHGRVFRLESGVTPSFPAEFKLTIKTLPISALGGGIGKRMFVRPGTPLTFVFNANIGEMSVETSDPFPPINTEINYKNLRMNFKGEVLYIEGRIKDFHDLSNFLFTIEYFMFPLLNLALPEPIVLSEAVVDFDSGKVSWQYKDGLGGVIVNAPEVLEKEIADLVEDFWFLIGDEKYFRVLASVQYLQLASRLKLAGSNPREFMAEVILNLAKALEVLFGDRDNVRHGLGQLGYSEDEIEAQFMPILLLRAYWGVAHPKIGVLNDSDNKMRSLFLYYMESEKIIKSMLRKLMEKLKEGSFNLSSHSLRFDSTEEMHLNTLIEKLEKDRERRSNED